MKKVIFSLFTIVLLIIFANSSIGWELKDWGKKPIQETLVGDTTKEVYYDMMSNAYQMYLKNHQKGVTDEVAGLIVESSRDWSTQHLVNQIQEKNMHPLMSQIWALIHYHIMVLNKYIITNSEDELEGEDKFFFEGQKTKLNMNLREYEIMLADFYSQFDITEENFRRSLQLGNDLFIKEVVKKNPFNFKLKINGIL